MGQFYTDLLREVQALCDAANVQLTTHTPAFDLELRVEVREVADQQAAVAIHAGVPDTDALWHQLAPKLIALLRNPPYRISYASEQFPVEVRYVVEPAPPRPPAPPQSEADPQQKPWAKRRGRRPRESEADVT